MIGFSVFLLIHVLHLQEGVLRIRNELLDISFLLSPSHVKLEPILYLTEILRLIRKTYICSTQITSSTSSSLWSRISLIQT
jgi:hypothetical protein